MTVGGKPFVSTFEGPEWADNWNTVREQTGGIFLVPDWSSIGPYGVGEKLDIIDGACTFMCLILTHVFPCLKHLTNPRSFLGCLAEGWPTQNDYGGGQNIQERFGRQQEVHDGRQPLLLHQYVPLVSLSQETRLCQLRFLTKPRFVLDLPQWNKNWYSSSESLWHDRWQQVLEIMPDYVQIITCTVPTHSRTGSP